MPKQQNEKSRKAQRGKQKSADADSRTHAGPLQSHGLTEREMLEKALSTPLPADQKPQG